MGFLGKLFGGRRPALEEGRTTITYRAGINETCRSIAGRFYGDEREWERVYRDNERLLKDEVGSGVDPLLPGTEITIKDARYDLGGQLVGPAAEKSTPLP